MGLEALDRFRHVNLLDVEAVVQVIRDVGVTQADVPPPGLSQVPMEFAHYLVHLGSVGHAFYTICEVGALFGWSLYTTKRYLEAKQRCRVIATAVDVNPQIDTTLSLNVVRGDSSLVCGACFDLVFIDGAHDIVSVTADWLNVGCLAKFCALHDIVDDRFQVRDLYKQLCRTEKLSREIVLTANRFGIGVFDNRSKT